MLREAEKGATAALVVATRAAVDRFGSGNSVSPLVRQSGNHERRHTRTKGHCSRDLLTDEEGRTGSGAWPEPLEEVAGPLPGMQRASYFEESTPSLDVPALRIIGEWWTTCSRSPGLHESWRSSACRKRAGCSFRKFLQPRNPLVWVLTLRMLSRSFSMFPVLQTMHEVYFASQISVFLEQAIVQAAPVVHVCSGPTAAASYKMLTFPRKSSRSANTLPMSTFGKGTTRAKKKKNAQAKP